RNLSFRKVRVIVVTSEDQSQNEALRYQNVMVQNWGKNAKALVRELCAETEGEVIALSFDPLSLAFTYYLSVKLASCGIAIKLAGGVFHPRDFKRENEKRHLHQINKILGKAVGLDKLYFMNEPCRSSHADIWPRLPTL